MHPYQQCIDKLEKQYNRSAKDLVRELYIEQDEGPSITARELDIPRKAVIYFIEEYNLRKVKRKKIKNSATWSK